MNKTIVFLLAAFSFSMLSAVWDAQKTNNFINAMAKAVDPDGNGKNIKSFDILTECITQPINIKMQSQVFYKVPNKSKTVITVPNIQTATIYFDGRNGFKVDTLAGVVPLEGKVLEEAKLAVMELDPTKKLTEIFDKIEIEDKMEFRDGKNYVVVNGSFKPERGLFPKKYLVDPKSKLIFYSISKANTELGPLDAVNKVLEHKKLHGMIIPVTAEQSILGMKITGTVKHFNVNADYPDSFFEFKE